MRAAVLTCVLSLSLPATGQVHEPTDIIEWSTRSFEGTTSYRLASGSDDAGKEYAVRADCSQQTASGLVLQREHRLGDQPILEWRWRVDSIYSGLDETTKKGDDYPARLYVVAERWPSFRSRAINYVWASSQAQGTSWENAFAGQFMMVAVRSGEEKLGNWLTERRNVREDFQRFHGIDPEHIDALAIMTDCDNAGQAATAWYGPIRWLESEARDRDP